MRPYPTSQVPESLDTEGQRRTELRGIRDLTPTGTPNETGRLRTSLCTHYRFQSGTRTPCETKIHFYETVRRTSYSPVHFTLRVGSQSCVVVYKSTPTVGWSVVEGGVAESLTSVHRLGSVVVLLLYWTGRLGSGTTLGVSTLVHLLTVNPGIPTSPHKHGLPTSHR